MKIVEIICLCYLLDKKITGIPDGTKGNWKKCTYKLIISV